MLSEDRTPVTSLGNRGFQTSGWKFSANRFSHEQQLPAWRNPLQFSADFDLLLLSTVNSSPLITHLGDRSLTGEE
jgi:hypothetical protein